jgi:hypothetical protein
MQTHPINEAGPALARAVTEAATWLPDETARFTVFVRPSGEVTVWVPGEATGVDLSPAVALNVRGLLVAIEKETIR